jgi:hypothetical protein
VDFCSFNLAERILLKHNPVARRAYLRPDYMNGGSLKAVKELEKLVKKEARR